MAFTASSFRVTEEDWLSETDLSGPRSFFWKFLLLLKELIIIFVFILDICEFFLNTRHQLVIDFSLQVFEMFNHIYKIMTISECCSYDTKHLKSILAIFYYAHECISWE